MPEKTFQFGLKGLVLKLEPGALATGQLMIANNLESFQEGALGPRAGSQRFPNSNSWLLPHSISKMSGLGTDAQNPRYVGERSNIWRVVGSGYSSSTDVTVNMGLNGSRWNVATYNSGDSGDPSIFFAHPVRMLKDDGSWTPIRRWGIPPPAQPPTLTVGSGCPNGPNGVYSYVYTYRNPQTGAEGNPCAIPPSTGSAIAPDTISAATNASPTVLTASDTYANGQTIVIYNCAGNTAPNNGGMPVIVQNVGIAGAGTFEITTLSGTPINGNGAYTGGGIILPPGYVQLTNQAVVVTVYGTENAVPPTDVTNSDPALSGLGSIAVYRAGGTFADGYYRFVGYAINNGVSGTIVPLYGGVGASYTFTDTASDISLVDAQTALFDNDMPVTANLPVPFVGTIDHQTSVISPFTRVWLAGYPNAASDPSMQTFFTPGSQVTIGNNIGGTANDQEVCTVYNVGTTVAATANYIDVYLQNAHADGEQVTCYANAGVPGDLICLYQQSLFVAGVATNPFVVYRSKAGSPDNFPVINLEDGNANQQNVGSPSDPIMGITEFNGEMVCLNQSSINVFIVIDGSMSPPQRTPSDRGMVAKNCWCKVKNEIWFLSYDGIYSWEGGNCKLRSEAIHSIFNDPTATIANQTYYQIDYTQLSAFYMECIGQEVWIHYVDSNPSGGQTIILRYQILYDRWLPAEVESAFLSAGIGAMYTETDTGRFICGVQDNISEWTISAISNASPDVITAPGNTLSNGQLIVITGCLGDTAPNGTRLVTNVGIAGAGTFKITDTSGNPINGNGAYTANSGTVNLSQGYLQQFQIGTSESWESTYQSGAQLQWGFQTGYVSPAERTRDYQFNELVLEVLAPQMGGSDFININVSYDYNGTLDPVDAFQIAAANAQRKFISFPLQLSSVDGGATGKQAMSVSLVIFAKTVYAVQLFSWTLRYNPLAIPEKNSILDWQSLGTPNDKQLYCLALEYDPMGQQITLLLDVIAGIPGVQVPQVQDITLQPGVWTTLANSINSSVTSMVVASAVGIIEGTVLQVDSELVFVSAAPSGTTLTIIRHYLGTTAASHTAGAAVYSTGRVKQVFPIVDNVICKAVRLRPVIPAAVFEIFNWAFEPIEKYPPDITYFSELEDTGSPYLKYFQQIDISVDTNGVTVIVGLELDGTIVFTFPINTTRFTRYQNITCPSQTSGVNARILPQLPLDMGAKFQLWDVKYIVRPADPGEVTHSTDWNSLGTEFDKQLQTISFSYDGSAGDVVFNIDELSGINGTTITLAAISFTLTATGRGLQSFAFSDSHIVKAIRVSPAGGVSIGFQSWGYSVKKLDFPPDLILYTDLTDNGSPFLKYWNQIILECNTNNVGVVVGLQLDGSIVWSFTVKSTVDTRRQAYVCPSQTTGINGRLVVQTPLAAGACFQLWGGQAKFVTTPADLAEVTHSYDYDSLEWAYDKRMKSIMFTYDGEYGDITVKCETIVGIGGLTPGATLQFQLTGAGRSYQQFPFLDGVIVKAIRVSPVGPPPLNYKGWKYVCEYDKYPPDFTLFTDKKTFGYACEKTGRNLIIEIDSGGVPVQISVVGDGNVLQVLTVTTSVTDRNRVVALNSGLQAREWWLELNPGSGGKSQLFGWSLDFIKEPCAVARVDTRNQDLGTFSFKWLRQCWLSYVAASPLTMQIWTDGQLFWTQNLPAQPTRDMYRFYLPAISLDNTVLNKGKVYQFIITATSGTLQLYSDSVIEYMVIGQGQRVNRYSISEQAQLPVG